MRKIPAARMARVAMIKAPSLAVLIPSLAGSSILRSRMAVAIGLRETNVLRVRDSMLRIQMSVRKGTQDAGRLRVLGIFLCHRARTRQAGTAEKSGPISGPQRKIHVLDEYTQIWEVYT